MGDFDTKTVESILMELVKFPAFVKINGDRIILTFHGNYKDNQKEAIEELMKKWDETRMNVLISWLGNYWATQSNIDEIVILAKHTAPGVSQQGYSVI